MNNMKQKIAQRQQANVEILQIIGEVVMKYPDLRFGQILAITETIQYKPGDGINDGVKVVDPFNEESVDMWIRMRDKIMELNRNNTKEVEK